MTTPLSESMLIEIVGQLLNISQASPNKVLIFIMKITITFDELA